MIFSEKIRLLINSGKIIIDKPGEDEITKALLNKMGKKKLLELPDKLDRDLQD